MLPAGLQVDATVDADLRAIIEELVKRAPEVEKVYLFGSRRYETGSFRSDIDLLVILTAPPKAATLTPWLLAEAYAVDLFWSVDATFASSLITGGRLVAEAGELTNQLDAVQLWSKQEGFSVSFESWTQKTLPRGNYPYTIVFLDNELDIVEKEYARLVAKRSLPLTTLGTSWPTVLESLASRVEAAVHALPHLNKQAKTLGRQQMTLTTEYDFQNLTWLTLKPWLPATERETTAVVFDGQSKNADFSLAQNRLIVEAKHVKDANTKANVVKTLEGLRSFYQSNANVQSLLFLVLADKGADVDWRLWSEHFSYREPIPILTYIIENQG